MDAIAKRARVEAASQPGFQATRTRARIYRNSLGEANLKSKGIKELSRGK